MDVMKIYPFVPQFAKLLTNNVAKFFHRRVSWLITETSYIYWSANNWEELLANWLHSLLYSFKKWKYIKCLSFDLILYATIYYFSSLECFNIFINKCLLLICNQGTELFLFLTSTYMDKSSITKINCFMVYEMIYVINHSVIKRK